MLESALFKRLQNPRYLPHIHQPRRKIISALNNFMARDFNQVDNLGVAWLEPDGGACRDVEPFSVCEDPVEPQLRVCFDKGVM